LKKSVEFFFKNKRIQGPTYVKFATGWERQIVFNMSKMVIFPSVVSKYKNILSKQCLGKITKSINISAMEIYAHLSFINWVSDKEIVLKNEFKMLPQISWKCLKLIKIHSFSLFPFSFLSLV
jgi:hypothetical protein